MAWYFFILLGSGFSSLVDEIVWVRLAMAAFGVTTPLVSIVLSVFMAGLAVGSWGGGRLMRHARLRSRTAVLCLYAVAELVIGISGLVVPSALTWGRQVLGALFGAMSWDSGSYYVGSGLCIAVTLFPFALCMGATLPVMIAAMRIEVSAGREKSFSFLYLANVLGATCGALAAAFVLIEHFGFRRTLLIAASLNAVIAAAALLKSARRRPLTFEVDASRVGEPGIGLPSWNGPVVLTWLFVSGLVSMAMEVVWIRQFTPYLGPFVYTFGAILAVYLLATFLGSQTYRAWVRTRTVEESNGLLRLALIAVGPLGLIPLITADPRLSIPDALRMVIGIAPFCALVGFLTPLLVDHWSSSLPERAGLAYATNVVGSILGPLMAGFWLLPAVGERGAEAGLALPLVALAMLIVYRPTLAGFGIEASRKLGLFSVASVLIALLVIALTRGFESRFPAAEVRRDHTATVIATGSGMERYLVVNGVGMTHLNPNPKMMAHLPLAHLDQPPKDGLVIAFGMGTTFRSLRSWGIPSTAVELVPSVPSLFGYYHEDAADVMRSPLSRIVIDDGRRFLERTNAHYDVITLDPPPPPSAVGVSLLYSREFYATAQQHLRPGGILHQWVPEGDFATLVSVTRALQESFPSVRTFLSIQGIGIHFLASQRPIGHVPASVLASRLPRRAVADLLEWGPGATAEEQFRLILAREGSLEKLIQVAPSTPALEDDRPINEYFLIRQGKLTFSHLAFALLTRP